jgi:hypothetical protein
MRSWFVPVAGAVALASCFMVGCGGDQFGRVPVAGTVTCEGIENPTGSILGTPADASTEAPNVGTAVTDGKFRFAPEEAPVAGSYVFDISLQVPGEQPDPADMPEGEVETGPEVLYQKTVDIPEGGTESLAIELTSADLAEGDESGTSGVRESEI